MVLSMDNTRGLSFSKDLKGKDQAWVIMEGQIFDHTRTASTPSSSSSIGEDSSISNGSSISSSLDTTDDATSYSYSSSANSSGSLYDLSDLMSQLPIKRGLSNFYQGKSQSFTSLSRVGSIEDLEKKESPYNNKRKLMKSCKSYGGGLDNFKSYTHPKPLISKKTSRGIMVSSSSFPNRKGSFLSNCRPPAVPLQRKESMI